MMVFFWLGFMLLCVALGGAAILLLVAALVVYKVYKVMMGNID